MLKTKLKSFILQDEFSIDENFLPLLIGLQLWVNMKPYSNQPFGPKYIPFTVGVSGKDTYLDQKTSLHKLRPGFHTTIHVIPKILKTTSDFNNLHLNARNCKLPHETTAFQLLREYSQKGCELECAVRKATSFCQCLPWQYPNNFQSLPICDMFGGYCFNQIMSNIIYYKMCKSHCLEDCQHTSLAMWHSTIPLETKDICKNGAYFDIFFKKNFQRLFAFESYQILIQRQSTIDLATSLSNGSLCTTYIKKYVAFVSIESPTKSVTKSHLDQRKFFIDKLGTIGGTLGVCAGMSVLSMVEVFVFIYIVLAGLFIDMLQLWKKIKSYIITKTLHKEKSASSSKIVEVHFEDVEENKQDVINLYVSDKI